MDIYVYIYRGCIKLPPPPPWGIRIKLLGKKIKWGEGKGNKEEGEGREGEWKKERGREE